MFQLLGKIFSFSLHLFQNQNNNRTCNDLVFMFVTVFSLDHGCAMNILLISFCIMFLHTEDLDDANNFIVSLCIVSVFFAMNCVTCKNTVYMYTNLLILAQCK